MHASRHLRRSSVLNRSAVALRFFPAVSCLLTSWSSLLTVALCYLQSRGFSRQFHCLFSLFELASNEKYNSLSLAPSFHSKSLRQDPLEAILVIFGRRALIFFCLKALGKKRKNDATFVRMRSGDHLGDAKMSKRAPRSIEFNFFNNCDRQKRFSQNERRRADLQNFFFLEPQ